MSKFDELKTLVEAILEEGKRETAQAWKELKAEAERLQGVEADLAKRESALQTAKEALKTQQDSK